MATPLMNLNLPTVSVTLGPQWASLINAALETIDSHDHTSGNGSLIPTAALNINSDLDFGANNATSIKSVRMSTQGAALAGANDKECIYSVGGALYYNNASGVAVQITSGTGLNLASVGTIGGDYGGVGVTASVTYNNTSKAYSFLQAPSATAKMAMGDILLYESNTASNAVTLKSPSALASAYDLTMFASLPASSKIVRMTSAGVLQNDLDTDNTTLEIAGSSVRIKDLGVTTAKIADSNVTTAKIADNNVTTAKIANLNVTDAKISSLSVSKLTRTFVTTTSSGAFNTTSTSYVTVTNQSVSFTVTNAGQGIVVFSFFSDSVSFIQGNNLQIRIYNNTDGVTLSESFHSTTAGVLLSIPMTSLTTSNSAITNGTKNFIVQIKSNDGSNANITNMRMTVYQV